MNKKFSKKLEQAARKHSKSTTLGPKNSFIEGAEFTNKHSEKQYTQKDMFQIVYDSVGYFAHKHNIIIDGRYLTKWFKNYIKK